MAVFELLSGRLEKPFAGWELQDLKVQDDRAGLMLYWWGSVSHTAL